MNTFPLERKVFVQASLAYAQRIQHEMNEQSESTDRVKKKITALLEEAKEAGVTLDDESAKSNSKAAYIRTQLDPLAKEFQKQASYFSEHVQRSHRMSKLADDAIRLNLDVVQVPLVDALPLAGAENIFDLDF